MDARPIIVRQPAAERRAAAGTSTPRGRHPWIVLSRRRRQIAALGGVPGGRTHCGIEPGRASTPPYRPSLRFRPWRPRGLTALGGNLSEVADAC